MTQGSRPTASDHQQGTPAGKVAAIIERRLGRALDPELNFFEAGLDSLALVELHEEIVRELAVELPVTALFTHPNLTALARLLAQGSAPPRPDTARRRVAGGGRRDVRSRLREDGR
ncbi:acyl carrier protein [Nonomuraea sp. NBC_01738]|uniref:acyl carrier protein n=1 Tax=Nonomuraea sp. NBC_01738 TaxID=2976003 RepID=UPI002E1461B1|nr:acyl carrier protein [Nonomuraea sp. NBC_01738]